MEFNLYAYYLTTPQGYLSSPEIGVVRFFHDLGRRIKRVEMGGNYQDTELAFTMRQRAVREMAGSLMNARQYPGKEAALIHA